MIRYEINSIEYNLGSLITTVGFRKLETRANVTKVLFQAKADIEGRYSLEDSEELIPLCEAAYNQAFGEA